VRFTSAFSPKEIVSTTLDLAAINSYRNFGLHHLSPARKSCRLLHGSLDIWRGIGDVVVRTVRQDYDLRLPATMAAAGRATFDTSDKEHLATSAIGSASDRRRGPRGWPFFG
jgi:hypothetical protein